MVPYPYRRLLGLDNKNTSLTASQVSALKLDNFIPGDKLGAYRKRGGSFVWSVVGDMWGIAGYAKEGSSNISPVIDVPIRHRRVTSTSYIEKLNWTDEDWDIITQDSNCEFGVGNIMSTAQIGELLAICAGKPAKITDIDAGDVEPLGGSAPGSAPSLAEGSAGNLSGTYYYVITYYDSTSGWESSPSSVSSSITVSSKRVNLSSLPTAPDRPGVDYKRVYRTIGTGEQPYRYVGQVAVATTTYEDNIADASLGEAGPDTGDHNPPPEDSYIVAAWKNRLWIADGKYLYYSLPDDGTGVPLEYFSEDRREIFPQKITALKTNHLGGLYVFLPPRYGIHEIVGRFVEEDDFENVLRFPTHGTFFHSSVSHGGKGDDVIFFWGEDGPKYIINQEIVSAVTELGKEKLDEFLSKSYSGALFVWSVFHPLLNQFIFGIAGFDAGASLWLDATTSVPTEWVDEDTGAATEWEVAS